MRRDPAGISENKQATTPPLCGFVLGGGRGRVRFCDRPAVAGSSYCARHRELCRVRLGSAEADEILAALEHEAAAGRFDDAPEPLETSEPADAFGTIPRERATSEDER